MSEENEVESVRELAKKFPVGCKVGKAGEYTSNIFAEVDFAHVVGYENDGDSDIWLLVYNKDWDGHSGHEGVLAHNLKEYSEDEIEKKYGEHCWWIEPRHAKRLEE